MAKDYKYRAQGKSAKQGGNTENPMRSPNFWKWMLITAMTIAVVVFLVYLLGQGSKNPGAKPTPQTISAPPPLQSGAAESPTTRQKVKTEVEPEHNQPRFDFYTLLPEKEVVVPDYEINTRAREERVGKAKETHYIMQAGSFKSFKETEPLRAKLGLLGIESKVHKAKVGNVIWYRVKIGPYARMSSVSAIKSRLRQNGIDVIVTETGE